MSRRSNSGSAHSVNDVLLALSERQFQRIVRGELERLGFVVWAVPNMKLTTAGLPDLTFWHPAQPGVFHAWELKRERDYRVTPKQRAAVEHLQTVAGIDARIVRPSDWEGLRDALIGEVQTNSCTCRDASSACGSCLAAAPRGGLTCSE